MIFDGDVLAFDGTSLAEAFAEFSDTDTACIGRRTADESDDWHCPLLRARRERPRRRRANQRDELAPLHSITSSARTRSAVGMVMPSNLAVLRLMLSSTFVACCTGISAGFSPL